MPDKNLLKVLGEPENKTSNNLKDVLGEPEVKKNVSQNGADQNLPSESVGQENTSSSQSNDGFRTEASPTQKPQVKYEDTEPQTVYEEPIIKEGQPISVPPKPKTKQQVLEEKVEQKTKYRWNKGLIEGTIPYPTPEEKLNNISVFKSELDEKYNNLLTQDKDNVSEILQQNSNKKFVQRILEPEKYPKLDLGEGNYATHKMAWNTDDKGNAYVYPTIVYNKLTKQLKQLSDEDAWQYAKQNNEFIKFNNLQEADWFSKNYKSVWDKRNTDQLIKDYQKELDEAANKFGLDKIGDRYYVPTEDIKKYNKDRESAIQEVQDEESLKNRSWLKAANYRLNAGIQSVGGSLMSLVGLGGSSQEATEYYQQKAQEHYKTLNDYVDKKDYLSAAGATALNVVETIPLLVGFIAGNKAGALNEVATVLGTGEGLKKYGELKDLDIPQTAKIFNSVGTSLNFILLSRIGGGEIANNVKSMVSTIGADETKAILQKTTQNLLQNSLETIVKGTSPALRGYTIGWSANFATNLLDKATIDPERNLTEGNNEAGLTWAMLEKVSTIGKDIQSATQDVKLAMGKLPKNIALEDYARSLDIVMEKDNLMKQNEVLDETFQSVNKERINQLKDKITFITQPRVNKEKIDILNSFVNAELAKDSPNIDKISEVSGEIKNIEKVKIPDVEPIDKKIDQLIKERDGIKLETLEGEEKTKAKEAIDILNEEIVKQLKQKQEVKQQFYDETIKGIDDPLDMELYSKEKQQAIDELKQSLPNINLKKIENEKIREEKREGVLNAEEIRSNEKPVQETGTINESSQNKGSEDFQRNEESGTKTGNQENEVIKPEEQTPPVTSKESVGETIISEQSKIPTEGTELTTEAKNEPKTSVVDGYSGIKKELFEGESTYAKHSTEEWMQKGRDMVENGEIKPKELIDDINQKPRALNPEEVSSFIYYKAKLDNKYSDVADLINEAEKSGNVEKEYNARVELQGVMKELDSYRQMAVETAYVQGLSFRLRQALLDSEYNLQSQIRKYKQVNNGEISPEVEAKFKEYSDKIDELNKKLRDKETEIETIHGKETISNIKNGAGRKPKERPGKELIAEGTSELAQALGVVQMAAGETRPEVTKALMKIGEGLIKEGIATIDDVIEKIKTYIDENFKDKLKVDDYIPEIKDQLIGTPKVKEGKVEIPPRLIRNLVESGVEDIEALTTKIHKIVNDPNITERQVRDAITKYGREVGMTKDEIQTKINEMNRVGRLLSQYEDVQAKNVKRKTKGTTPKSQKEVELKSKIKQAAKDLNIDLTGKTDIDKIASYKKGLKKSIDQYKERLKNKDFEPVKKKEPIPQDKEVFELELEKNQLKEQFDLEFEKAKRANRSGPQKTRDIFVDAINLPKSLMASADLSAPLRQGALLSFANPIEAGKATKEMFRQAFSGKKADRWLAELKVSPEYQFMRNAKLYISEPTAKLAAKEESFMTNIAHKIPVWGHVVKGSERAYVGYLNKLRVDVFNKGAGHLDQSGFSRTRDIDVYKSWANFINNATGRGNLGKLEPIADLMNTAMFSPRLVASRFNLLNPVTYAKMPPAVRKMALRNVITYVGVGSMILGLSAAAGADVELDPRSSDFGKIKVGDTRYDIWAGFQQWVRTLTQLAVGQRKRTSTGEIVNIDPNKYPYESRLSLIGQFGRSKLSPITSLLVDVTGGKGFAGEDVTLTGVLKNEAIPLYLQDMTEIYKEEGLAKTIGSLVPGMFGVGTQYYETNKRKRESYEKEIQQWRKENDPNNLFDRNYIAYYKDIMHKVNKIDQDKELNKLIDAEDTEGINRYLDKKKATKDWGFYLNNSSNIDKLSRIITYFKYLPKEDQQFYANELQLTIDDMKFAYDNDDMFEISDDLKEVYEMYQNRNEQRRKIKGQLKSEL